ncbi:MAG: DUF2268 domain-containing putative Zn-dependent protease [Pseudomonadota bacterium]
MTWTVHIANAQNQFSELVEPIQHAIEGARRRCERALEPLPIDVVVLAVPGRVIPERGYVGYAPTGTMMQLTFDPSNSNLIACLGETLERTVAHEFHHVMRWRGPGYGRTLGEALVSEGLAGRFVEHLYGAPPEPWEDALSDEDLTDLAVLAAAWWTTSDYDHGKWFFGQHDYPRWAGYTLGYRLVGQYLADHPDETAASLVDTSASQFRAGLSKFH